MPIWQSVLPTRFLRSYEPPLDHSVKLAELRGRCNVINARVSGLVDDVVVERAQLGQLKGEWLHVGATRPQRLLLYLHGGYYVSGSPEAYRPLIARLCKAAGAAALSLDYRVGPEYPYPACLRDAVDAYRFLISKGFPLQSVVLAGDGSGGGLAFAAAMAIRNSNMPMPAAVIAMSPWADLTLSGWSVLQNAEHDSILSWDALFMAARYYLKGANPADAYASPVFGNMRDFPPIMVHAGSREILRDDAGRLGELAAAANVSVSIEVYDGMPHLFQGLASLQEAKISINRLGQFIKSRTPEGALTLDFSRTAKQA